MRAQSENSGSAVSAKADAASQEWNGRRRGGRRRALECRAPNRRLPEPARTEPGDSRLAQSRLKDECLFHGVLFANMPSSITGEPRLFAVSRSDGTGPTRILARFVAEYLPRPMMWRKSSRSLRLLSVKTWSTIVWKSCRRMRVLPQGHACRFDCAPNGGCCHTDKV